MRGGYDSIGFVFTSEDSFCGVDLDKCRDADSGELEEWAREIIDELNSYTEISPSKTGVHVILRAALPPDGRNHRGPVEVYGTKRYLTWTGQHLPGTPETIESRQEPLEAILERVFKEPGDDDYQEPPAAPGALQDDEVIKRAHAARNGDKFSRLWAGDVSGHDDDDSRADAALCAMLAFWTGPDPERIDALFRRSGLCREKWTGREDYRARTISEALNGKTEFYTPGGAPGGDDGETGGGGEPTQAELLIRLSANADLFHTPSGDSYATVPVGEHRETHPVKAKGFRRWLLRAFYERVGRPPGNQALQDALGLLEARADFDGPEREVYIRTAEHGGNIYIDLANKSWEIVEITLAGWRIVAGKDAPVRFRRPAGMLPLPPPAGGDAGADELLRRFLNVGADEDLRLVIAWLVAALRPVGPYPALLLQGEQGSAKSTAARLVRALVDPSAAPLRTTPRSEHDLYIAADNAHVVALDNISSLQPWMSDALCRLSTGGGFSTRTLYENREEELFEGVRPVILNGITDVATRPDLLDRALIATLPAIPDEDRKPEKELWRNFHETRPAILAALFDAVSGALSAVEDVRLEGMPRMADFALWATAAEESLGWENGAFIAAYQDNRDEATGSALDADPVAGAVLELMQERDEWVGTASELWSALGEQIDEDVRRTKIWPGAPNALTSRLKRLAPTLRGVGIEYGEDRSKRSRKKRLTKNIGAKDRHHRHHRHPDKKDLQNGTFAGDGPGDDDSGGDDDDRHPGPDRHQDRHPQNPIDTGNTADGDDDDGGDDDLQLLSNPPETAPDADDDLRSDVSPPEDVSGDVRALLENPPNWLKHQLNHVGKQGYPARLLKPTAASMSAELYGSALLARDDVLPVLEAFVGVKNEEEGEEVHIL